MVDVNIYCWTSCYIVVDVVVLEITFCITAEALTIYLTIDKTFKDSIR